VPKDYTGYFIIPESPGKICRHHFEPAYPAIDQIETPPLIVIDTLSMWTGKDKPDAEDINRCLDLLKQDGCVEVDEFEGDTHEERLKAWRAEYPGRSDPDIYINDPVASCVIIIHHPTKAGDIYAGQGSIGNNTQALYRVSRGGKLKDNPRVMTGTLTAWRTKDMTKPAPIRFEAEVVPVPNTTDRRIVIIRDRAIDIPSDLLPIVATLREQPTPDEISDSDLKALVDEHVAKPGQSSNALRTARHRCTKRLLDAGLIERNEDDSGQLLHFQFNDPGPLPC
jgi:hypothetical protein